ncbi:MAG: GTPase HflX [Chlorobi bacterium]|nr:GTPase HflX [Chlorobiota bacterium]
MRTLLPLSDAERHEYSDRERGIAVAISRKGSDRHVVDEYLDEIEQLCHTAGADIVLRIVQERERLDPATFVGKGKVIELQTLVAEYGAQFVIFDENLSPVQVRNLQQALGIKILDRSMLILDIFAKHARTIEAKTQVELAQLQYLYPRLTRLWTHLSRQYGGIGTKGPGETQIETDRRLIKERIAHLQRRLRDIEQQRRLQRQERASTFRFALVGYTNAGKSSLFNLITDANVRAEDQLFATLDTTVRRFTLPSGIEALLSDTVGFIRKLPANLVASFHSTLAEAVESDMLVHVADASHPALDHHIQTVEKTLATLGIEWKPRLLVLNKIDRIADRDQLTALREQYPSALLLSAMTGYNVHSLLRRMDQFILDDSTRLAALLPYSAMRELSFLYTNAIVESRQDTPDGIAIIVRIPRAHEPAIRATLRHLLQPVEPSFSQQ